VIAGLFIRAWDFALVVVEHRDELFPGPFRRIVAVISGGGDGPPPPPEVIGVPDPDGLAGTLDAPSGSNPGHPRWRWSGGERRSKLLGGRGGGRHSAPYEETIGRSSIGWADDGRASLGRSPTSQEEQSSTTSNLRTDRKTPSILRGGARNAWRPRTNAQIYGHSGCTSARGLVGGRVFGTLRKDGQDPRPASACEYLRAKARVDPIPEGAGKGRNTDMFRLAAARRPWGIREHSCRPAVSSAVQGADLLGLSTVGTSSGVVCFAWSRALSCPRLLVQRAKPAAGRGPTSGSAGGAGRDAPTAMLMSTGTVGSSWPTHRWRKLFGYGKDELIGQPVELLVPETLAGPPLDGTAVASLPRPACPTGLGRDLFGKQRKDGSRLPGSRYGLRPLSTPTRASVRSPSSPHGEAEGRGRVAGEANGSCGPASGPLLEARRLSGGVSAS